jgi:hypothetical protein
MAARIVGQNRFGVGLELDLSDRLHADGDALLSLEVLLAPSRKTSALA